MSVLVALVLAIGVFAVYDAATASGRVAGARLSWSLLLRTWLAAGGLGHVTPAAFIGACVGCGLGAAAVCLVFVGSPTIAAAALLGGCWMPAQFHGRRRREIRARRREAWPEAVDLLAGSVRAGDTLPAALAVLADRGPSVLQPAFRSVVSDHRVSGDLVGALVRLGDQLADPVADRVVATLVVAHRVGGRELVRVLVTLGAFLREDLAVRKEVAARQSWTLVAARVAASAPVLVLLLVASRPEGAHAFDSFAGFVVVAVGGAMTIFGYRLMVALGRLPEEPRVLRVARSGSSA
ncbi:MAG: secretion system protein [Actinobacteria bacterium]|nr:secretion system protein [Actinomycetota bacterium]